MIISTILTCSFLYVLWNIISPDQNKIKYYWKKFFYNFYALVMSGLIIPIYLMRPGSTKNSLIAGWLSGLITYLYDLDFILRNGEVLAEDRGAVIVANHQNSLDIIGLFKKWHVAHNMAVATKKELYYVWPFGLAASLAGAVFIDRSNPKAAYESLKAATRVILKDKTKIWVFPEGTRNRKHDQFLPFKKGAFVLAVAAQVPVIPLVYSPYYFVNKNKYIFTRGHVIMQCLDPIPTKGLTEDDIPALIEDVREKMFTTYKELRKEVLNGLPDDYPYPIDC